jgi:hypothetical protein
MRLNSSVVVAGVLPAAIPRKHNVVPPTTPNTIPTTADEPTTNKKVILTPLAWQAVLGVAEVTILGGGLLLLHHTMKQAQQAQQTLLETIEQKLITLSEKIPTKALSPIERRIQGLKLQATQLQARIIEDLRATVVIKSGHLENSIDSETNKAVVEKTKPLLDLWLNFNIDTTTEGWLDTQWDEFEYQNNKEARDVVTKLTKLKRQLALLKKQQ